MAYDQLPDGQRDKLYDKFFLYFERHCSRFFEQGVLKKSENQTVFSGNGVGAVVERYPEHDNYIEVDWRTDNPVVIDLIRKDLEEMIEKARSEGPITERRSNGITII